MAIKRVFLYAFYLSYILLLVFFLRTVLHPTQSPSYLASTDAITCPCPTPSPSPTVSIGTSTKSVKKGVGVVGGYTPAQVGQLNISWGYSWCLCNKLFNMIYQHVPMIWGRSYSAGEVAAIAQMHPGSYWLIFNEPDYWRQANIRPTEAAQIYRVLRPLIRQADPTAKLIVGGVMSPANYGWIRQFRAEYYRLYASWPVIEGFHLHYYADAGYTTDGWRQALTGFRNALLNDRVPGEIWLTEWGSLVSPSLALRVMREQTVWMESQSWLNRYAFFATTTTVGTSLLNGDGTLTQLGTTYRGLP